MQLLSCRLRQVRRHRDLQLRFGRRLTLISGANEAGKSTLVEALHKGLFLKATATGRGVEELRSRLHAGLPEVDIRFSASGEIWTLRKRFAGASGTCQLSHEGGLTLNGAAAEERLAALLGVEGPVEGRRLSQLPERWAHLWVRQGEATSNPLAGGQERYDYQRLVDQLQHRSGPSSLESSLDRQVVERIQEQLAQLFTSTGRVKAGSALAISTQREREAAQAHQAAQARMAELEEAMEEWRRLSERLERIDAVERPALLHCQQLEHRRELALAELEPTIRQHDALQRANQQRQQLQEQQHQMELERKELAERLAALDSEHQQQQEQQQQEQEQLRALSEQRQQLSDGQQLLQQRLDQLQLQSEQRQLLDHQQQFQRLQRDAATLKAALAQLPAISADQVRRLRQAEQGLAQAEARCEAMAASVELLQADQPVLLDGTVLQLGERRQLDGHAQLQVGAGVVLQFSAGGGEALSRASAERERSRQLLSRLQQELAVANSDEADRHERERQRLETELANLRKAAAAIPWAGLQERLDALAERAEQQEQALQDALASAPPALGLQLQALLQGERRALEQQLERWRHEATALQRRWQDLDRAARQRQQGEQQRQQARREGQARLEQLHGSLQVLAERLSVMAAEAGEASEREQRLQQLDQQIQERRQQIASIEQELQTLRGSVNAGNSQPLAEALQQLEQEREMLLTRRGQSEQLCASLGAQDPCAELEQRQAEWEQAASDLQRLERRAEALQLLLQRFHAAQADLANRYSEPLQAAIQPYLTDLAAAAAGDASFTPLVQFDPQQGFDKLQLRQGQEAFGFERLSGGMREQLAAALRLAMAEVLQPAYDDCLPLVFDDAFTNSDPERLQGLLQMLRRGMDQGIQILLLTCQPQNYCSELLGTNTHKKAASPTQAEIAAESDAAMNDAVMVVELG